MADILGLREILRELVREAKEIEARTEQPECNKGLDLICAYEETEQKIRHAVVKWLERETIHNVSALARMELLESPMWTRLREAAGGA